MKKCLLAATLILLTLPQAFATESTEHHEGPCSKLMDACKAAGFNKSNLKDNKSLSKDCIQPLLNEEKVAGVKLDESVIKACKLKKAELKK